ncbi:hypothetical protein CRD60_07060 [Bifidobacterium aemilianum]|uniref:DUF3180 domain-containing protein n=1 Tax=Bifidobacterium aemilianum TaxID=2493120 RepID=A0A366K7U0_9BIFI|nr:DUF3180 domain-containing protein [Bifidobacterium aemilianum]RBP97377.1 hypothetical protein CRD60_07060 [Bifidobacterium aemilianum]
MKVRRTPWWYYLLALVIGLLAGLAIAMAAERFALSLIGAPWMVSMVLLIMGIVILVLALQVHKYATTEPAKRRSGMDPAKAVYTLVSAKALGLAGAALTGWYGGQILVSLPHLDAPYYKRAIMECALALVVCLIDMVIGIIGEKLCELPPTEGPEHPKVKEAKRRRKLDIATDAASGDYRKLRHDSRDRPRS